MINVTWWKHILVRKYVNGIMNTNKHYSCIDCISHLHMNTLPVSLHALKVNLYHCITLASCSINSSYLTCIADTHDFLPYFPATTWLLPSVNEKRIRSYDYCVWEGYIALYIFILCLRGIHRAIYLHTVSERDTSRYLSSYLCLRGICSAIYLHTVSERDTLRYISSYCVWEGYVALYIFIQCLRGIHRAIYLHICVWEGYVALYIFILCLRGIRNAIYLHTVSEGGYIALYIFIRCLRGIHRAIYIHTVSERDT